MPGVEEFVVTNRLFGRIANLRVDGIAAAVTPEDAKPSLIRSRRIDFEGDAGTAGTVLVACALRQDYGHAPSRTGLTRDPEGRFKFRDGRKIDRDRILR
jgi:hypothetical protein